MTQLSEEDRLRRLVELGPTLVSELDLETLLDRVLETACELTGAHYAALGILDVERRQLERFVTRGLTREQERAIGERPRGRGILGLLIDDPRPVRIADVTAHPSSFGFPSAHPEMHSFLGVPIVIRGLAWGNLYLTEKGPGEFTEADEWTAVTLAAWASIAIDNARLLRAANDRQAQLASAVRRLEATQAVAVAVGAETDLSRVLELIAKRGRAIIEARSLLILLSDGRDLVIASAAGHARSELGKRLPVSGSTAGEVMRAGLPRRIDDPASQLRISPSDLGVSDPHAALIVPLIYRGEATGVIMAFDRGLERLGFTLEDEHMLLGFAASASTAVATARTVAAERLKHSLEAAEAERKHWARELHDETLQSLGSLKVLASAARRGQDAERMRDALDRLVDGLEEQIESVHTIISELRPAALDELGLRPALETLADRHAALQGSEVQCDLDLPDTAEPGPRLAPEVETTVYRLIQEALSNAAKHANATRVRIAVSRANGLVQLEVADDGVGFDPSGTHSGFGLTGMRERVSLAGGSIEIDSGAGGTRVHASLPALERPADASA